MALAAPRNGIVEIAGPERAPFNEIVARYMKAVGDPREELLACGFIREHFPGDLDASGSRGQRTIFRGIGRQLVEDHPQVVAALAPTDIFRAIEDEVSLIRSRVWFQRHLEE